MPYAWYDRPLFSDAGYRIDTCRLRMLDFYARPLLLFPLPVKENEEGQQERCIKRRRHAWTVPSMICSRDTTCRQNKSSREQLKHRTRVTNDWGSSFVGKTTSSSAAYSLVSNWSVLIRLRCYADRLEAHVQRRPSLVRG
jgi:hypothetical protein